MHKSVRTIYLFNYFFTFNFFKFDLNFLYQHLISGNIYVQEIHTVLSIYVLAINVLSFRTYHVWPVNNIFPVSQLKPSGAVQLFFVNDNEDEAGGSSNLQEERIHRFASHHSHTLRSPIQRIETYNRTCCGNTFCPTTGEPVDGRRLAESQH